MSSEGRIMTDSKPLTAKQKSILDYVRDHGKPDVAFDDLLKALSEERNRDLLHEIKILENNAYLKPTFTVV